MQFRGLLNQKCISLFSEVFADDVIFTQEMECPNNTLTLQCNLSDTNTVTTMHHMTILQRNISELYEDVVTISFSTGSQTDKITWYNDTIKNISLTEGSSIIPANESRLIVHINLKRFEMREDSMMFMCKTYTGPLAVTSMQFLTVWKGKIGKFC
jgi:hypothetical protein